MRRVTTVLMVVACWALCLLTPVGAQESPKPALDQYASGPDAECPGAQVVNTPTGTGPNSRRFTYRGNEPYILVFLRLDANFCRGCAHPAMQPPISATHPHHPGIRE